MFASKTSTLTSEIKIEHFLDVKMEFLEVKMEPLEVEGSFPPFTIYEGGPVQPYSVSLDAIWS